MPRPSGVRGGAGVEPLDYALELPLGEAHVASAVLALRLQLWAC